jgi:hypothetical protein
MFAFFDQASQGKTISKDFYMEYKGNVSDYES